MEPSEPSRERSRERELAAAQARIRELERLVSALAAGLSQLEDDLRRIGESRAWRWGHGVSVLGRRLARRRMITEGAVDRALERIERIRAANAALPSPAPRAPAEERPAAPAFDAASVRRAEGPQRALLARELRARLGGVPERAVWPRVTLITVSRDGQERLARLLDGLSRFTDYPDLELIVFDNGSDSPLEPSVRSSGLADAQTIRSETNRTFSEANNQAAANATGEVLLFVNDDIEPFESGWLKELVSATLEQAVGAVGATLLHVAHAPALSATGWIVQHRGIRFRLEGELPRAYNAGDGTDLFDEAFGAVLRCPAASAACLAVRREAFEQMGGFSGGYRFGTEDVDLGLKLLAAGWDVRCSGRAIAFHRESATQSLTPRLEIGENRRVNRQLFHERWAARLQRELRRARLERDGYWTEEPAHVGVTLTSLDPEDGWGDWFTAHELGEALEALGARVTYLPLKRPAHPPPGDLDALITLVDRFDATAAPATAPVLAWVRNWTHRWTSRPWFARVDRFLASSGTSGYVLEDLAGVRAEPFPLATNPARFQSTGEEPLYDYALTSNRWGVERGIEQAIAPRDEERVAIFGAGWEEVNALAPYWHGPVPYERLPEVYARTKLVLDDTAEPTLEYDALNARVFDALACGALPITNCARGAHELFDDDFPTWSNAADLRTSLDRFLADEPERRRLATHYRSIVLAQHTYADRAAMLLAALRTQVERLSFVIRIAAPDRERAELSGDFHFAQAVERELKHRGHRCLIQMLEEWDQLEGNCFDVSIVLRGRSRHHPKPGQLNVLWSISHPDDLTSAECDDHDLVAVASELHAEALAARTTTPVFVLEQATDARRFRPEPDPSLAHDVVFVANSRGVRREALDWLLPSEHDVAVWGSDWDGLIDRRYLAGDHVANDELRRIYSSAKVVLADHWPDMREHGYISNRVYDALASGAMVLSDAVSGLDRRFGDAVAIYRSREQLRETIDALLADEEQRRRRADRGRELVRSAHTFEQRVDVLLERVGRRRRELGFSTSIAVRAEVPSAHEGS